MVLHAGVPNFGAYLLYDAYKRREREKANDMDEYLKAVRKAISPIFFTYCSRSTPIPDLGLKGTYNSESALLLCQ